MRTQNFVTRRRVLALAVSFVFGLTRVGVVDASPAAIHERPFASTLRVLIIDGDADVRLPSELRMGHDDLEKRLAPFLKGSVPRYERSQREGLAKMQSGVYDLIVAPSHIIARATQSGYAVIAESQRQRRTAFVVPEAVTATSLHGLRDLRLCITDEDSLTTYQAKAALAEAKIVATNFFLSVRYARRDSLALNGTTTGRSCDVAAVDYDYARSMLGKREYSKHRMLATTTAVPAMAVASREVTALLTNAVHGASTDLSRLVPPTEKTLAGLLQSNHTTPFEPPRGPVAAESLAGLQGSMRVSFVNMIEPIRNQPIPRLNEPLERLVRVSVKGRVAEVANAATNRNARVTQVGASLDTPSLATALPSIAPVDTVEDFLAWVPSDKKGEGTGLSVGATVANKKPRKPLRSIVEEAAPASSVEVVATGG